VHGTTGMTALSRAWQIILKDSPIIPLFGSQFFSPLFFKTSPLIYSSIVFK